MAHLRAERPLPRELPKEEQDGPLTPARAWKSWKIPTTTRPRAYIIRTTPMAREDDDDYDQDYVPRSREVHSAPEANLTDLRSLVERRSLRRPQILATQWSPEHPYPDVCRFLASVAELERVSDYLIVSNKIVRFFDRHAKKRHMRIHMDPELDVSTTTVKSFVNVCRRRFNVRLGLFITPVSSARQDANHTWLGLVFVDKAGVKHVGVWDSNHVQKLHDYGMTTENAASTKILCTTAS
jgi:hypothetical protein